MNRASISSVLLAIGVVIATPMLLAGQWSSLRKDGLHDPSNPAVRVLQEPAESLSLLAPDTAGNNVDWTAAVRLGQISPRASLDNSRDTEILDTVVVMKNSLTLLPVTFPHEAHTAWMSCAMCHDGIFVAENDANDITMAKILAGEYCGVCHGAVSFPLTECNRCHDVSRQTLSPAVNGDATVQRQ